LIEYNYSRDNITASGYSIFDLQMDPGHIQNVEDRINNHPHSAYDPDNKADTRKKKDEIIIEPNRLQSTTSPRAPVAIRPGSIFCTS
jgi:hypothetical protein